MSPTTNEPKDLLGRALSADEKELLVLYERLKVLSLRDDLPPCAVMNCKQAMVLLWNACVDLDLFYAEPGCD